MSGTNQFVGLVAVLATSILYFLNGGLLLGYSSMYGMAAVLSSFVGIRAINAYVARSGKQSTMALPKAEALVVT